MKRILIVSLIGLSLSLFNAYSLAGEEVTQKGLSLSWLIQEALENNPRVQAAKDNWLALREKVPQARSLDDPMAGYGYFGESIQTKVGPQRQKFGISQKIPFMGKLSLRGKVAQANADVAEQKYEAIKREVIKDLKKAYFDYYFIVRAIAITEEEKMILENLEMVARRRYESGQVLQQDVLKAQVEITKLIDELLILGRREKTVKAMIDTLLNRPLDSVVGQPEDFGVEELGYGLEELRGLAKETRQELLMARSAMEKDEYLKSLAKLNYFPDFTFGFDYIDVESGTTNMADDGQDAWMGSVKINLPIWQQKLSAKVKEAKSRLESTENMYQNIENQTEFQIEDLFFKLRTAYKTIDLYENSLIPQAEQAFTAARTGYESGDVDFLNWLESERMLLKTRLKSIKEKVEYQKLLAELERVVGKDL